MTRRTGLRLAAVGGCVLTALILWVLAEYAFRVDLRSPAMPNQPSMDIGLGMVVFASATAALAGWGLLALLERLTARARTIWAALAAVVLALSLGAPLSGSAVTAANRTFLALMHLAVGAVLILVLYRTAGNRAS